MKAGETDSVFTNIHLHYSEKNGNQTACFACTRIHFACSCGFFLLFCREGQLCRLSISIAQDTFKWTLLENVVILGPKHLWMWPEWSDLIKSSMCLWCVLSCLLVVRSTKTCGNARRKPPLTCSRWHHFCMCHLNVLPILCLQQALVISINAKGEVRAGNNVSPVAPDSHFVPSLSETHT